MEDQGAVRATTPRDLQLLRWIGEMYGVPLQTFGDLLAKFSPGRVAAGSRGTLARRHAQRLETLGLAVRRPMLGHRWVFLTPRGMREAGLPFQGGALPLWKLDHTAVVARLRLHIEAEHPTWRWESERWIRYRYRQAKIKGRIPDGLLELPEGYRIAIEVELTRKGHNRYPELFEAQESWRETWWYVPTATDAVWLRDRMAEAVLPLQPHHSVHVLPGEVVTP
jgi:hypothetical protein